MNQELHFSELMEIFRDVDDNERKLVENLVREVVFLETRMAELKEYPFISVNPRNPAQMRQTAAAKQYKECSQSYMNAVRILLNVLRKVEETAQDELLRKLEEFSL